MLLSIQMSNMSDLSLCHYYTPLIENIMAYRFVTFPMMLNDLEGHSPVAGLIKCNSTNIWAMFRTVSTDTARLEVPRRYS